MRIAFLVAASALALTAAPALAQEATTPADPTGAAAPAAGDFTDAEIEGFAAAMAEITPIAQSLGGAAPSAEQQAEMAAAIESAGLTIDRFNAIGAAARADRVTGARVLVAQAPAGTVEAGVTDQEVEAYASAMAKLTPIARALNGAAPDEAQQAEMAGIVSGSGLSLERFNEISTAASTEPRLRARVALADARAGR